MFDNILARIDFTALDAALAEDGYYMLEDRLETGALEEIKAQMDQICATRDDLEVNYGGSEHRLWHAQRHLPAAEAFRVFSDSVIPRVDPKMKPAHTVLAIRNKPLTQQTSALLKGRWHLDSFNKQLKIFVFMRDVSEDDGPFELIPRTHRMPVKIRHALQAQYFRLSDYIKRTGKRGYHKIDEGFIDYVERRYPSQLFTVPAGSILVADTSAIHRAHPVNGGERYAFTSYH